jgi:hypothetical protein
MSSGSGVVVVVLKRVVLASVAAIFLGLFFLAGWPFPEEINGLGPKTEYYKQLFFHLTGLTDDWDMDAINSAYFKHFEATGQKLPDISNRSAPYSLRPLAEIDPKTDAKWEQSVQEKVSKGEAVVVRKLMYHSEKLFPKAREWNIDFLRKNLYPPGTLVPVFTDVLNDKSVVMQDFSDYVDGLKNKSRKWYARCLGDAKFVIREGYDSVALARIMGKETEQTVTRTINDGEDYCIFVGSTQVSTRMHCDITTSSFLMVQGRKRWVFFPPDQSPYVFPFGHQMNVAYNSRVDIFAPKDKLAAMYPFLSLAKGYETILEAGDVLFFSSFNWHGVQNLDDLTVGFDAGVVDGVASFTRNAPLTLGTYGNINSLIKVVRGFWEGSKSLKQAFFLGYNLDEKEAERVKEANGVGKAKSY